MNFEQISSYTITPYKTLFIVVLVVFCQKINATSYYINDKDTQGDLYTKAIGNDANDGLSPTSPKLSLRLVCQLAKAGDVVYIDTGHYLEDQSAIISRYEQKIRFVLAPQKEAVLTKKVIPTTDKTNPTEFYIENDKPVERSLYLQHKRNEGKKL